MMGAKRRVKMGRPGPIEARLTVQARSGPWGTRDPPGRHGNSSQWCTRYNTRSWIQKKEQAEAEVYRRNIELQQRVEERTRDLREKAEALTAANERLKELARLKSEFVSLVSHELRAPLTNVRSAIELMELGSPAINATCAQMFEIVGEQS